MSEKQTTKCNVISATTGVSIYEKYNSLLAENERLRELLKMARATGSHTATRVLIDEALGENE